MKKEKPEFLTKRKFFLGFFGRGRKLGVQPEAALKEWQEVETIFFFPLNHPSKTVKSLRVSHNNRGEYYFIHLFGDILCARHLF